MDDNHLLNIANIMNAGLTPDGWDVGIMDDIAGYLAARGLVIDWVEGEDLIPESQSLDSEVAPRLCTQCMNYHPNTSPCADGRAWAEALGRDVKLDENVKRIKADFNKVSHERFKWNIELVIRDELTQADFIHLLTNAFASAPGVDYEVSIVREGGETRLDNCPF